MKKLNLFRVFDWEGFSMDKTFVCAGAKYSERKQMIVVEIAIIRKKQKRIWRMKQRIVNG